MFPYLHQMIMFDLSFIQVFNNLSEQRAMRNKVIRSHQSLIEFFIGH